MTPTMATKEFFVGGFSNRQKYNYHSENDPDKNPRPRQSDDSSELFNFYNAWRDCRLSDVTLPEERAAHGYTREVFHA